METMELTPEEVLFIRQWRGRNLTGMPNAGMRGRLYYFWTWGLQPTDAEVAEIGDVDVTRAAEKMRALLDSGRVTLVNHHRAVFMPPPKPRVQPVTHRTMPR